MTETVSIDRELEWLRRAHACAAKTTREEDRGRLLEQIMQHATHMTDAERGFLVRLPQGRGGELKVVVALGFSGEGLRGAAGELSRTVVRRVLEQNRSVVTTRDDDADILEASSVQARRVRSVICVPLRLRGEITGALYLDDREDHQAFRAGDAAGLQLFADQAALALETADLLAEKRLRALRLQEARREIEALRAQVEPAATRLPTAWGVPRFESLVGGSPAIKPVYVQLEYLARSSRPAVLVGEVGAGKHAAARVIHGLSRRRRRPLLSVDLAGIDPARHAVELFGERTLIGTVTEGLIERASPGTLVISGLELLRAEDQARLVAMFKQDALLPVGGAEPRPALTRILAAFREDPEALVAQGRLDEELFLHLDVQRVAIPPLRDRTEDIPALLAWFLGQHRREPCRLERGVLDRLLDHDWPGNVRELENLANRVATRDEACMLLRDLPAWARAGEGQANLRPLKLELIQLALAETGGNKSAAARRLGVPRSTLYRVLARAEQGGDASGR